MKHTTALFSTLLLLGMGAAGWSTQVTASRVYENYTFTTLAGNAPGCFDGKRSNARFNYPAGVAVDAGGNIYVADADNHTVRKISTDGVVSTLAGLAGESGSVDGFGGHARFRTPICITLDSSGTVYVADNTDSTIRKISPAGLVSTLAGASGKSGSADGTGSAARFSNPRALAADSLGNVYVSDADNCTIRKITPAGVVSTFAGLAGVGGSANGTGSAARFDSPYGVAVDTANILYVADTYNHTIRKITPDRVVSTLVGSAGVNGSSDGTNSTARFNFPCGLATDPAGNVYVADINNRTIRKVTTAGVVTTLAGSAEQVGEADGLGSAARFNQPMGVAVGPAGVLYVADLNNQTVRQIATNGLVSTLAGSVATSGSRDGTAEQARFQYPAGMVTDTNGNLYIADLGNHVLRKITPEGVVSTLAGAAGSLGTNDGPAGAARFYYPSAVVLNTDGALYVADYANHAIRKVTLSGEVSTFAGVCGRSGTNDGLGSAARFWNPIGLAQDAGGNLYVADTSNDAIRKISPAGAVTTLAGSPGSDGFVNGTNRSARFSSPKGIAVDSHGTVYVADAANNLIRRISPEGVVSTLAGSTNAGAADGTGAAASFWAPYGLAVDRDDNVYVGDINNNLVRKITPAGVVSTLGGSLQGSDDGSSRTVRFYGPEALTFDRNNNLYVSDCFNHTIRKAVPSLPDQPVALPLSASALGVVRHLSVSNLTTSSWSWDIVRLPASSRSAQLSATNTLNPTLTPDVADLFVVRFQGHDSQGRLALGTLSVETDQSSPALRFTAPTANQRWSNAVFQVTGSVTDNSQLDSVWCHANEGNWVQATLDSTNWSANVPLFPGTNLLRAYARDAVGNLSSTSSVSFYYAAFTPLVLQTTGKGSFNTPLSAKPLEISKSYTLTAVPAAGFVFDRWSDGATSSLATLSFVMRSNLVLTAHFRDTVKPILSVTAPRANQLVSNSLFEAAGKVSDNFRAGQVWCQLNSNAWLQASGSSNWTAGLMLAKGLNTLRTYAMDADGNRSLTNTLKFTYVPCDRLNLATSGWGKLTPNYSNAWLEIGRSYTLTASPNVGNLFSNWTGGISAQASVLKFTMSSNLVLRANFVTNAFTPLKGNYAGLFFQEGQVWPTNAGLFTASLNPTGGFTASLQLGASNYPIAGRFSVGGAFSKSISRGLLPPLALQLQLDLLGQSGISGQVDGGSWISNLKATQAAYSTTNAAPQGGQRFTLAIAGGADPVVEPVGYGYGSLTVGTAGNLLLSARLGDGTVMSQSSWLNAQGQWPLYASLYGGKGLVLGWMGFTNQPQTDLQGLLYWSKLSQTNAKPALYLQGFQFASGLQAIGSRYVSTNGVSPLQLTNGLLILDGGNLSQSLTNSLVLGPTKATGPNQLNLAITNLSGMFQGSLSNPVSHSLITAGGVLLQKANVGYGTFLGTNQSGKVWLKVQ